MDPIKKAVEDIIQRTSTNSASNDRKCRFCSKGFKELEIELFGRKRNVWSAQCDCEYENHMEAIRRSERYEAERKARKYFAVSDLGSRFEKCTFDSFAQREGSEMALKMARKYSLGFESYGPTSLLIWGEPGNGKSHLSGAIAHDLGCKGKIVVFQSIPELLEKIRSTFGNNKNTESELMSALLGCDLLILDDIGAEKVTDWVLDVLFRIIDGRYRREKPILYTSNLKPSELLDKLGKRIYDRILETTLPIQNKATSYREEKARERFERFRSGDF